MVPGGTHISKGGTISYTGSFPAGEWEVPPPRERREPRLPEGPLQKTFPVFHRSSCRRWHRVTADVTADGSFLHMCVMKRSCDDESGTGRNRSQPWLGFTVSINYTFGLTLQWTHHPRRKTGQTTLPVTFN